MRHVIALMLLALPATPADLISPIASGSKHTYAQLLRKVFPNLKVDAKDASAATASKSVTIRPLIGNEQPIEWDSEIRIKDVQKLDLRIPGKPQALLMFTINTGDGEPETSELALFDVSGAPRLLDVADVPAPFPDDHGWLWDGGFLHLNATTDALVITSEHHNSNESFQNFTILFVRAGRLTPIAEISPYSCRGCDSADLQEKVAISTLPDAERDLNKLRVRVTLERQRRPRTRTFTADFRWDPVAQKYTTPSQELDQLAEFNAKIPQ